MMKFNRLINLLVPGERSARTLKIKLVSKFFVLLSLLLFSSSVWGQTTYDVNGVTGDWSASSSWSSGSIAPTTPASGSNITVRAQNSTPYLTLYGNILASGSTYNFQVNTGVIDINGNVTLGKGALNVQGGSGKLIIRGNLTLGPGSSINPDAVIEVWGNVNVTGTSGSPSDVHVNGKFIVHGNFTGDANTSISVVDGVMAVGGNFTGKVTANYNGGGNLYAGGSATTLTGSNNAFVCGTGSSNKTYSGCPIGNMADLQKDKPDLYTTFFGGTTVAGVGAPGGVGNAGGTNGQPRLALWLDANSLSLSNGDVIASWADRSGNGNNAVQSITSQQPKFTTNVVNGKPVIRFTSSTSNYMTYDGSTLANTDLTVLAVGARRSASNNWQFMLGGTDASANKNLHMGWSNSTTWICNHYGNDITSTITPAAKQTANTFGIFMDRLKATDGFRSFSVDGEDPSTVTNTNKLSSYNGAGIARYNDGSSYRYFDVDVAEVIEYTQALNTAQQIIVNNYLNAKYGMTIKSGTDKYTSAAGYNSDVAGVGKESDGSQVSSPSAGFWMTMTSTPVNGTYVIFGHDGRPNQASTSDLPSGVVSRWNRIWNVQKTGNVDVKISFDFSDALGNGQVPLNISNYVLLYRSSTTGAFSVVTPASMGIENGDNVYFTLSDANFVNGYYTLGSKDETTSPITGGTGKTWYSLVVNGNWDDASTWTLDPSGKEPVNPNGLTPTTSPTSYADKVVVLTGKTVTIQAGNNNKSNLSLTVNGRLDCTTSTGHSFVTILGNGRILLAGDNFPSGDASYFVSSNLGAGTVVYYGASRTLSTSRTFCNLEVSMDNSANVLTFTNNYTLNGYLSVKNGVFKINDDASTSILSFSIAGDVTVAASGSIITGQGNTVGSYVIGTKAENSTMPSVGQYHNIFHQFSIGGNFTNNGIVRFTNQAYPAYNAFTATGGVTVRVTGLSNSLFSLNNTTDFYNLIIDKGSDQSYITEINASNVAYFKLFGPNNVGRNASSPFSAENPEVCKALWIKNGTLKLTGLITIPSLSEGGVVGGNGDYAIGANAQLWIAGPNVTVNCTADDTDYPVPSGTIGVNNTSGVQALSVYGTFRITDGFFNSGYSAGFIFWNSSTSSAEVLIDGGVVNTSVFRSADVAGAGKASYVQTNGQLVVRGNVGKRGEVSGSYPIFGLLESQSVFRMSGGEIVINSRSTNGTNPYNNCFYINSAVENTSVTGGQITFSINSDATNLTDIYSNANLWNVSLNRMNSTGTTSFRLNKSLIIKNDLVVNTNASLKANNYDVTISGNMVNLGDYTPGINTTTFDGSGSKTFTNSGTITPYLSNWTISKTSSTLTLAGTGTFTCNGTLKIASGTLNDGGLTITAQKDIANSGIHAGTGKILMTQAGVVSDVTITNAGSYPTPPTMTIAAPASGTTAAGTPVLNGVVTGITVTAGGSGYTGTPTITFSAPASGITATGTVNVSGGVITGITITDGGSGYQSAPMVTFSNGGSGSGATFSAATMSYTVTGVTISNPGSGYTSVPTVTFSAGTTTATGTASIYTQHQLSGSGSGQFGNLELDESNSAITTILKANQQVNGTLTMTNGILDLDIYNMNLVGSLSPSSGYSATKMLRTAGNNSDGGLTLHVTANGTYLYPIGTNANSNNRYTPASMTISDFGDDGNVTIRPVDKKLTTLDATKGDAMSYYWRVNYGNFSVLPKVSYVYNYDDTDLDGLNVSPFAPGKVLEVDPFTRSSEAKTNFNTTAKTITFNGGGTSFSMEEASYTAGDPNCFVGKPTIYYLAANGDWSGKIWSATRGGTPLNGTGKYPQAGDVAIIRRGGASFSGTVTVSKAESAARVVFDDENGFSSGYPRVIFSNNTSYSSAFDVVEVASTHAGGPLDGQHHGAVIEYVLDGSYAGQFPTGDFALFNRYVNALVDYVNKAPAGTIVPLSVKATEYPQIWTDPGVAGNYMRFPATDVTVHGMTYVTYGNQFLVSNGAGNITFEKQLNLGHSSSSFGPGSFLFSGAGTSNNTVTVLGDLNLNVGASQMGIYNASGGGLTHKLIVKGNVVLNDNANVINLGDGTSTNTNVILELQGSSDKSFANANSASVTLYQIVMNKGTDQTNSFTFNTNFTLTGASNISTKPLTLQNGRLFLNNPNLNLTLTSGGGDFSIPATTGLIVQQGTVNVTGASTGISLGGLLRIENTGQVLLDGGSGADNYIEYSGSGNATIQVAGSGVLTVGSQIRRSTISTTGILKYSQTGGTVTVGKNAAPVNQRGVFEIVNTGSDFTFTGGTLSISRGQTNPSIASFYLEPGTSNIATGTTINLGDANTISGQTIGVYSTVPLQNLTTGSTNSPTIKMWALPLTLNGDLTLGSGSTFNANGLTLTCNGNFTNNGTFTANSNTTVFSGSALQTITGNTTFYNWTKNTSNTVKLGSSTALTIANDMALLSGTLDDNGNNITVLGDLQNTATHVTSTGSNDGITMAGTYQQKLFGNGTFGKLCINNASGVIIPVEYTVTVTNALKLKKGVFDIGANLLVLGSTCDVIAGNIFSSTNMIQTNISYTDKGIKKIFPAITSSSSYLFPIGSAGKYTPITFTISNNANNTGSITFKAVNQRHVSIVEDSEAPSAEITDADNVLQYYWSMKASGISGFSGNVTMQGLLSDAKVTSPYTLADYVTAFLYGDGSGNWTKFTNSDYDESSGMLTFKFTNKSDAYITGDYTAGIINAIPNQVPFYETNKSGDWTDGTIWTPNITGGPRGARIRINTGHTVTIAGSANNNQVAYTTELNGKLDVGTTIGHSLGNVKGTGTLYTASGNLPAGFYTDFVQPSTGTFDFGGSSIDYDVLSDFGTVNNLIFSGSGKRRLPNIAQITVYGDIAITGADLLNEFNQSMDLKGNFILTAGSFNAGSGSNAKVSLTGTSPQSLSVASANLSPFYNLIINKSSSDVTLNSSVYVSNVLTLTQGLVNTTSANILTLTNQYSTAASGGSSSSFINGPLKKNIASADGFVFPVGKVSRYGIVGVNYTSTAGYWIGEYFNTGKTGTATPSYTSPLTANSVTEYWNVQGGSGNHAKVTLRWDSQSDLKPSVCSSGLSGMRVAEYNTSTSKWEEKTSSASGDNTSGTVITSNVLNLDSHDYTLACIGALNYLARFANNNAVCAGTTTTIPVEFLGGAPINYSIKYTINGGASQSITGISSSATTITATTSGVYQLVEFKYNNASALGAVDNSTVTANVAPSVAVASDLTSSSMCGITTVALIGNTPTTGTGVWSIQSGSGGSLANSSSPASNFTGTAGNTYVLRWSISSTGCPASTKDINVSFWQNPTVSITPTASICAGSSETLNGNPTGGSGSYTTHAWTGTGVSPTNSATPTFSSATAGTKHVTYTVTDSHGCQGSNFLDILINALPITGAVYRLPNN